MTERSESAAQSSKPQAPVSTAGIERGDERREAVSQPESDQRPEQISREDLQALAGAEGIVRGAISLDLPPKAKALYREYADALARVRSALEGTRG